MASLSDESPGLKEPEPASTTNNSTVAAHNANGNENTYHAWKLATRKEFSPFDVQVWYPILKSVTFPTWFTPLSRSEAEAIVAQYRSLFCGAHPPTQTHLDVLSSLSCRLDEIISSAKMNGCFVRLSSRSPKDAAFCDPTQLHTEMDAAINALKDADRILSPDDESNARLQCVFACSFPSLRCVCGRDALRLLCTSERAFRDLLEALEAHEVYNAEIIVREWQSDLDPDFEFRGFVYNGALTALSQYNHYVYLPNVCARQKEIMEAIDTYWVAHVRPLLLKISADGSANSSVMDRPGNGDDGSVPAAPDIADKVLTTLPDYSACVVDFCMLKDGQVRVIELNPFHRTTGAALFDWTNDDALLRGESSQFGLEFRVNRVPLPSMGPMVDVLIENAVAQAALQSALDLLPVLGKNVSAATLTTTARATGSISSSLGRIPAEEKAHAGVLESKCTFL
eukprot:Opistho-2@21210